MMRRHEHGQRNPSANGGWWCTTCNGFVELNLDREQNVCAECGRPTIKPMDRAGLATVSEARGAAPKAVAPERAHELFEGMRKVIE